MNHASPPALPFAFKFLVMAILPFATVAATAQAPASPDLPEPPFDAIIALPSVEIRSGAGRAYYEVGTLAEGDKVRVQAELFGWYKIQPPGDVYCFVERKDVNVRGDGSRGIIETDNTAINAAHANNDPSDSYRNLIQLNAGDTVEIIDTIKNAYKIIPPADAFVYLPPQSLRPATRADIPEPMNSSPPAPAPDPEPEVAPPPAQTSTPPVVVNPPTPRPARDRQPETTPTPGVDASAAVPTADREEAAAPPPSAAQLLNDPDVAISPPAVPISSQAENELLSAVEVAMLPYFTLPAERQPIAKMTRGYADAAQIQGLSDADQALIRSRLAELERNRGLAQAKLDPDAPAPPEATAESATPAPPTAATLSSNAPDAVAAASAAVAPETSPEAGADPEPESDPAAASEPPAETTAAATAGDSASSDAPTASSSGSAAAVTEYDAVGILTASTVHTGNNQPELYRLLDPTGKRTIAYLEPSDNIDRVQMIGRLVGITGSSVYDPTTRLNLIQPTRVDILSPR